MKPSSSVRAEPLPPDFIEACTKAWGAEAEPRLLALNQPAVSSIRLHPQKRFSHSTLEKVPWHPEGRYLLQRPVFTLDPAFHAGAYYVQEASSMVLWEVINQLPKPKFAIDLAAAPGGKSTLLLDWMQEKGWLLANEPIPNRALALQDNLKKWGYSNSMQSRVYPEQLAIAIPESADLLLLDAPCSGEGMFRKDAFARQQWSFHLRTQCAKTQTSILPDAVKLIKPGGHLIYSTCTFNEHENHGHADLLFSLGMRPVQLNLSEDFGFKQLPNSMGWIAYPGEVKGEGFYFAVWKKEGTCVEEEMEVAPKSANSCPFSAYLPEHVQWNCMEWNSAWYAIRQPLPSFWSRIPGLQFLGICLGKSEKGRSIPDAHLAFISGCSAPRLSLDEVQVLPYLKGLAPVFKPQSEPWILAEFNGLGLGWLKTAGNRFNNAYPQPWRIRMDIPAKLSNPWL